MVGAIAESGELENVTTPTRAVEGSWLMNVFAAFSAASRRLGWTSFASIEPERSSTSISDASRTGTRVVTCGRASAIASAETAASIATTGTCRRQSGRVPSAATTVGTAGNRIANRRARRRASRCTPSATGTSSSANSHRGA